MSARKKWDFSVPPFTDYYSPKANVSTSSDSYIDGDRENDAGATKKFSLVKEVLRFRTPLAEVNQNADDLNEDTPKIKSNMPKRTKSCPNQFLIRKKKGKVKRNLPYNLRKTPERLSRASFMTALSNESDVFIDANENLPVSVHSPLVPQPDARILRNRSIHLTSTAKKNTNHVAFITPESSRKLSSIVDDSNLAEVQEFFSGSESNKTEGKVSNTSEVFHTPSEELPETCNSSYTIINNLKDDVMELEATNDEKIVDKSANSEAVPENHLKDFFDVKTDDGIESEEIQDKRGSYVVTNSVFNPCDLPHTPAPGRSLRSANSSLTSEEPSLFQVNYVNRRSISKISHKKRKLSNVSTATNKSIKSSVIRRKTVCQPFHLITDERYPKIESSIQKERSFNSMLRCNNTPKTSSKSRRITKVSPFKFSLPSYRERRREDDSGYTPLAERVAAHFKTPTRFRSTSRLTVFQPSVKQSSPEFVRPKTPTLHAMKRRRTVNVLSHEQQLELEAIKMRKHRFKATSFNRNILNRPFTVKDENKKPPTIPEGFNLETEKRVQARKYTEKTIVEEPKFEFKARKVPKSVLQGPSNVEKTPARYTMPQSPRLSLKERAVKWKNFCSSERSPEVFVFKATPAPIRRSPRNLKPQPKTTLTTAQPFTFHEKDKIRFANKEKKIQEELEEKFKSFKFQATEIPACVSTPKPLSSQVKRKSPTVPEPFNLHPGNYSSRRSSNLNNTDYNVPKVPSATKFKAKAATVLKKKPFIPRKNLAPIVERLEFCLHTEERAKKWEQLEEERKSMEIKREAAMKKFLQEQEEREQEELRQLRQDLVHKAQPVPKYKPFEVKPSDKPPTTPISPPFATKERLIQKSSTP